MVEHFSEFSRVTFVTIHVLCFATGQNDTVDHPFLTF